VAQGTYVGFGRDSTPYDRRLVIVHAGAQERADAPAVPEMLLDDCTDRVKQIPDQFSFGPESIRTKETDRRFQTKVHLDWTRIYLDQHQIWTKEF
jgi:hypothetical protein